MAIKNLNPQGILAQISNVVSKAIYKDIKTLLTPCCKPSLSLSGSYACTGESFTVFNATSVTYLKYKDKWVNLIFTFTLPDGTISTYSKYVLLDSFGNWTGNVIMQTFVPDSVVTITVGVIPEGSEVVSTSAEITVTDVPNCD